MSIYVLPITSNRISWKLHHIVDFATMLAGNGYRLPQIGLVENIIAIKSSSTKSLGYRLPQIGLVGNLSKTVCDLPVLAGYRLPQIGLVGNSPKTIKVINPFWSVTDYLKSD